VTGNIRNAFFFLAAMMWVSLPLLGQVDVMRGKEDAKQYISDGGHDGVAGYTEIRSEEEI